MDKLDKNHEIILENLRSILDLLNRPPDTHYVDGENRLIGTADILKDLSISKSVFDKRLKQNMPFLRRLADNGDYRCRLSDYRKWKKQYFNL